MDIFIRHNFGGGWATDYGTFSDVAPDQSGYVTLPFLLDADDVLYELDGGPRLAPGTTQLAGPLESGAAIKGIFDFWLTGATGAPAQHRILHVGTKIKKDNANGTFTDLITGLTSGAVPCSTVLNDLFVTVNGVDTPKSWDGTTAGALAGTPPTAPSWVVRHLNRLFMGGDKANPSRLFYSAYVNGANWSGADTGYIDIDPDDGDGLVGAASYKGQLILFKGPYKGSIHVVAGSAPTGSDAFSAQPFVRGVGAVHQNSIFMFGDDLGWVWSDGTVRSLSVTAAYGNLREAALSRPIGTWIREHVTFSALKHAYAQNWAEYGIVLFALPADGGSVNSALIAMDYRFSPARFSYLRSFGSLVASLAMVVDSAAANRRVVMAGGPDGYVRKLGAASRSIDVSGAMAYKVTTPFLNYGQPAKLKGLSGASVGIVPRANGDIVLGWQRDGNPQQTQATPQTAGAALGSFTLDVSTLGGARYVDRMLALEEGGEFRAISYQIISPAGGAEIEMHNFGAMISVGADSFEQL